MSDLDRFIELVKKDNDEYDMLNIAEKQEYQSLYEKLKKGA